MKTLREIFINNLKFYRKEKGFSQEKLSKEINMGMNYINQVENKYSFPPPEIIEKISSSLKISPYQLFLENGSPENIENSFFEKYGRSIHDEISECVQQAIDDFYDKKIQQ